MGRRVLITGGSGFVGRQIVSHLRNRGLRLRLVTRSQNNLDGIAVSKSDEVVEVDDLFEAPSESLDRICSGVDDIVHAAWFVETGSYLDSEINLKCLTGTIALAKAGLRMKVKRFVGIGTCFEYDLSGSVLSVKTPLRPETLYGSCKAATFLTLNSLFRSAGIEFLWCRLFYLFGEGEKSNRLYSYLHSQLSQGSEVDLTSGDQIRDFMDVQHAGAQLADFVVSGSPGTYNICSGIPTTVREFAEKIADQYGGRELLRFGVRRDNLLDPACVVGERNLNMENKHES